MKSLSLFLVLFIWTTMNLVSEEVGVISGKVYSASTGQAIPGVTVRLVGTKLGAISATNGKFEIKNVPVGMQAVKFTSIAFQEYVKSDIYVSGVKPVFIEVELVDKVSQSKKVEVRASYFTKRIESSTSTQTLNAEDIRRAPGVQEDVVRATALLPGVNVTSAGRNDLIVRGGAPFENLFVVDGIEVQNINHFGSQGSTGGPLSIINIDFVNNVDFSSGGFGVKYGDKTASITNITLRNGNEEAFGGKLNLSATGFGLNLEGPISDQGSYLFSARRSYLDFIFDAAGFSFVPQYWDFQGKVNYRLDSKNSLSFVAISALNDVKLNNDDLDNRYDNSRVAIPEQVQIFSGLTWKHLFESGFSTVTIGQSYVDFLTFQNDSNLVEIFRNDSRESELILKADVDLKLNDQFDFAFGNQVKYGMDQSYDVLIPGNIRLDNFGNEQALDIDSSFSTIKNATYANLNTKLGPHRLSLGLRMDYFNFTEDNLFLSPRASFTYFLNETSSFVLSAGRYYQSPSYIWMIGALNQELNPIRADQMVIAYEHTPMEDVKVQLEFYGKLYSNYPARIYRPQSVLAPGGFDDISLDIPFGLEPLSNEGEGRAYGVELFIQKKLSEIPVYGLLSLTLAKSEFKSIEGVYRPSKYDSRFIANLALGWRINQDWELSGKFRLATGVPTTNFTSEGKIDYEHYNEGDRLPVYHAMDVRVDRRWTFSGLALITYLDIQNVYNKKNISGIDWNFRENKQELNESSIGLLPSIGINLEF